MREERREVGEEGAGGGRGWEVCSDMGKKLLFFFL